MDSEIRRLWKRAREWKVNVGIDIVSDCWPCLPSTDDLFEMALHASHIVFHKEFECHRLTVTDETHAPQLLFRNGGNHMCQMSVIGNP